MNLITLLRKIRTHPGNAGQPLQSLWRAVQVQLGMRRGRREVRHNWVLPVRLVLRRGYHSLIAQAYFGLSEYAEMQFLIDTLQPDDLYLDAGANMGAYSLLAAGVCKAKVIAVEPLPENVRVLNEQIAFNNLQEKIRVLPIGLSDREGQLHFLSESPQNTFVVEKDHPEFHKTTVIPVRRAEDILTSCPRFIKIDVEGHEAQILRGLGKYLYNHQLQYIQCEMVHPEQNGKIIQMLEAVGFVPRTYDVEHRKLIAVGIGDMPNVIWVRG